MFRAPQGARGWAARLAVWLDPLLGRGTGGQGGFVAFLRNNRLTCVMAAAASFPAAHVWETDAWARLKLHAGVMQHVHLRDLLKVGVCF